MWIVGIVVILGWIVSVCLHEFGHAVVAYFGGDTSVKDKGYLTLNPTKYIDPQMSLVLPVFFLLLGGIALPGAAVYVNEAAIRNRQWRSAVSAAGPIASALSVLLLAIPFWLWNHDQLIVWILDESLLGGFWAALAFLILLNVYMVFLNSLPIPPLDGFGVLRPWLPPYWQAQARKVGKYGILILFGLIWFVQPFNQFLWGITFGIVRHLGIPPEAIATGAENFRATTAPILVLAIIGALVYQRFFRPSHERSYDRGISLLKSHRYQEALTQLDQALKSKADDAKIYIAKGLALEALKREDEAIATYTRTIELNPDLAAPYQRQASLFIRKKRYDEAIACYHKLVELEPNNLHHQGALLFFTEQYQEAIALYDQILTDDADNAMVWCNKACCYSKLGDLENVITHLQRAIEIDPKTKDIAKTDPDLSTFRTHPAFQALLTEPKPA